MWVQYRWVIFALRKNFCLCLKAAVLGRVSGPGACWAGAETWLLGGVCVIPQCIAAAKFLVASPHPSLYQPCWKFGVFCCLRTAYLVVKLPLGETEIFLMTMSLTLPTWKSAPCFAGTIDSNILPGKDHGLSHGLVTLSLTVAFCQVWVFWVWFWFGFFF